VPEYTHNLAKVVSNTTSPAAGVATAVFCRVVMFGNLTPLVVDCASRIAEAFGVLVPIPTLAALFNTELTNILGVTFLVTLAATIGIWSVVGAIVAADAKPEIVIFAIFYSNEFL
jgi:hypothetical protein